MKIKKINHIVKLDNMVLVEFETDGLWEVPGANMKTNLFRWDYSHDSGKGDIVVAMQDSHYVGENMSELRDDLDYDYIEQQLEELYDNSDNIPDATEEYLAEMEEGEEE